MHLWIGSNKVNELVETCPIFSLQTRFLFFGLSHTRPDHIYQLLPDRTGFSKYSDSVFLFFTGSTMC